MGGGGQTEERVRFVYGFMRRSKSSTGMRRAHLFSGASGGRRSASAAVDGATAIPHLNEDICAPFQGVFILLYSIFELKPCENLVKI